MMRKKIASLLYGVVGLSCLSLFNCAEGISAEPRIEKVGVRYGTQRPFSFYYPYNYEYYTPSKRTYSKKGYYGSSACYWRYTNGGYVYFCQ